MAICIYPPNAEDFSTNGLGALTPIECTVDEQAGGKYELKLEQPIDHTLRWAQLQNGCIVKAPAPVRENPLYEYIATGDSDIPVIVTREVYRVVNTSVGVRLRTGPGTGYRRLSTHKNGTLVVKLDQPNSSWMHVCMVNGGAVGYMSTEYLTFDHSETESVSTAKPGANKVIQLEQSREQLFRIFSVETDTKKHTVNATAMHVFYDLRGNMIDGDYSTKNAEAAAAVNNIYAKLANDTPFIFYADRLTGKVTGEYGYLNPVEALLDPDQGIVPQTNAQIFRDNFDVHLLPDTERDMGVTIRRGKNLVGVTVNTDASNVVTRIIPVGKNKDGDPLYLDGVKYIDSPHINDYPIIYTRRIEYDVSVGDDFKTNAAARAELRRLAEEDFSVNGIDLPTYGMEVDFVLLQNTPEYANYASLQAVHLYDTVTVIDSLIGLRAKLRVTGYSWDAILKQYSSITLGELQELEQTVYSYNLPEGGIRGTKIMPNTLDGTALRNATIQYAKIAIATIQQLNAESINALTARLQEIIADSITTDELYVALADINKATIQSADIDWASIERLTAMIATLAQAEIGTADIDWAHIKDLATDTAIITEGVGGKLFISRLAVTEANMVSLTTGELVVKGEDGRFYSVSVDANGQIQTEVKQVGNDDVLDLSINAGEKIIEGSVTAACLNATDIFADNAVIRQMIAANLDVDQLFAREAFIALLRTSRIVGDKSITLIAQEAAEANRNFFQSGAPSSADMVRPGDTWTIPDTGQVYQAEDMSRAGLKFWLDSDGNLSYSLEEDDGSIALEVRDFDLYAQGIAFNMEEDGTIGAAYRWVRVQDQELAAAIQGAAIHDGAAPPEAPIAAGKLWLDRSVNPMVLRRWLGNDVDPTDMSGWEIVNDTAAISAALDQVRATALSREDFSHYVQAKPEGLYVGLLNQNSGYTRITYSSFDVINAQGSVTASLGDAKQDLGNMTIYTTSEGHTAFVPREV